MSATLANGQPAATVRRRVEGEMRVDGVVVIAATTTGIAHVVAFHHAPSLALRFTSA
jgi:RNA polymerase sigma-70 factor (ECF subfamily)